MAAAPRFSISVVCLALISLAQAGVAATVDVLAPSRTRPGAMDRYRLRYDLDAAKDPAAFDVVKAEKTLLKLSEVIGTTITIGIRQGEHIRQHRGRQNPESLALEREIERALRDLLARYDRYLRTYRDMYRKQDSDIGPMEGDRTLLATIERLQQQHQKTIDRAQDANGDAAWVRQRKAGLTLEIALLEELAENVRARLGRSALAQAGLVPTPTTVADTESSLDNVIAALTEQALIEHRTAIDQAEDGPARIRAYGPALTAWFADEPTAQKLAAAIAAYTNLCRNPTFMTPATVQAVLTDIRKHAEVLAFKTGDHEVHGDLAFLITVVEDEMLAWDE